MATYLRTPSVERLPVILEELHTGSLRIPPFQRDFEWSGEQRINLFDSILKGLPTGSLMVWRTNHALRADPKLGPYPLAFQQEASQYLLDGRQRMTTLYAALAAGFWTRDGKDVPEQNNPRAPDGTPWEILFNLDTEAFGLAGLDGDNDEEDPQANPRAPMLRLGVILDDAAFDEWRARASLTREQVNRARNLRSAFVDYLIPVVPLATDDIGVVTMTFKRVNSGGTAMGDADMTRALAWSEGYDLREQIEGVREELLPRGWGDIDDDTLLKAIAGIALTDPTTFDAEELAKLIKAQPDLVTRAGAGLTRAVDLLGARLGIRGVRTLPNVQILLFAARAFDAGGTLTPDQEGALVTWAAEACLDERFGSAPAHMLRAYFRALKQRLGLSPEPASNAKRRNAAECWKFRMIWARSRGTALVLAAQGPTDTLGRRLPEPERLIATANENIGMLLARGADGLPAPVAARLKQLHGVELQSPANRFVCPPEQMASLRRTLFSEDCPDAVRVGHLVDPEAHRALLDGDLMAFFERRRNSILRAEESWVAEHGGHAEIVRDQRSYSQG